jgi:hypothetical protein
VYTTKDIDAKANEYLQDVGIFGLNTKIHFDNDDNHFPRRMIRRAGKRRVDYWPMAISGERGNGNHVRFHETIWTEESNCSACKRASGHEKTAAYTMSRARIAFSCHRVRGVEQN